MPRPGSLASQDDCLIKHGRGRHEDNKHTRRIRSATTCLLDGDEPVGGTGVWWDGAVSSMDELTVLVDRLRRDRRRDPRAGRQEYSQTARELAGRCERLLAAGDAAGVAPVLRRAVDRMTKALMYMDDSSGIAGDDLREMMALYAQACTAARPDAKSLARWLVTLAYDGPGWPEIRLREFASALGERGLAEIAARVEQRAAVAAPGYWGRLFATRTLREQLAEISGDIDLYVGVLAENLDSAAQYLRIVNVLRGAARPAAAIIWARRGLAEKGSWPQSGRLRDVLVDLLLDDGDTHAAMGERREEFERHPTAAACRALTDTARRCADEPGDGAWAIGVLRARVARQPAFAAELIAVLLAEGQPGQAWQVGLDHAGRLSETQLTELLDVRQATCPADVVGPYQMLIGRHILDAADKRRYQRAIALLTRLHAAYQALGDTDAFSAYIGQLRAEHKRRPTFLTQLDAAWL
jgi:hypothetical protein